MASIVDAFARRLTRDGRARNERRTIDESHQPGDLASARVPHYTRPSSSGAARTVGASIVATTSANRRMAA